MLPPVSGSTSAGANSMVGAGAISLTWTMRLHVLWQLPNETVSVNSKEPGAPTFTVTTAPSFGPEMVPLPAMDQLCVAPAGAELANWNCRFAQADNVPEMLQLRFVTEEMLKLPLRLAPFPSVTVTDNMTELPELAPKAIWRVP